MKIINVLENINPDEIKELVVVGCCTGCHKKECDCTEFGDDIPMLRVTLKDESKICHKLTSGFKIFDCNEFLRSFNLMPKEEITFETYPYYVLLVRMCNKYLTIRRVMEDVSGVKYDEAGIYACQIYDCILNRLLAKHHMASKGFDAAMQKRPIAEWVAEAITYFR